MEILAILGALLIFFICVFIVLRMFGFAKFSISSSDGKHLLGDKDANKK